MNRLAREMAPEREVVSLDDCFCVCSTMFRIDPPHLLWALENLRDGRLVNVVRGARADRRRRPHRPRPDAGDQLTAPETHAAEAPAAAPRATLILVVLIVLAPVLLLLGAALTGRGMETDLPATGDYAALELYTRLAAQGRQLLGPYSRFGFHHPGPAYFYASVPLYVLTGERFAGILLTAALVNVVSIALMLRRLGREGGGPALLAGALVIALFLSWRGPAWLFSAWNPNVAVLPFGVALVEFAAVAAGNLRALPLAVLAASFAAQTHLGVLPTAAAVALAAALLHAAPIRRAAGLPPIAATAHRWILLAVVLAAVVWTPPLLEQISPAGGNLSHIFGFSSLPDERHSAGEALVASGAAIVGWMAGAREGVAAGLLVVLVLGLAVAHGAARVTRQAFAAALSLVTFAGIAAAILSATRVTGPLLPYLLRWMAMLSVGRGGRARRGPGSALAAAGRAVETATARRQHRDHRPRPGERAQPRPRAIRPAGPGTGAGGGVASRGPAGRSDRRRGRDDQPPPAPRDRCPTPTATSSSASCSRSTRRGPGSRCGLSVLSASAATGRRTERKTRASSWAPKTLPLAGRPGVRLLGREAGLFAYLVPPV